MSYESRDNLSFADDANNMSNEEFMKIFAFACQNAKLTPAQNPCQYMTRGKMCGFESYHEHLILPEGKAIRLCDYHERKLKRSLGGK